MSWSYFHSLPKIYRIPLIVAGVALLGGFTLWVFGFIVMWLWNHVLAAVFDVPSVTFWQALGLFVLAKLFFGFGGGSGGQQRKRKRRRGRAGLETAGDAPETDERFQDFWRQEGKLAYEAYVARKRAGAADDAT